ncbi:MAG: glycine zipper 2TM domain-containing protein [Gammaproteobacteria bacterium]|nr:glycine zipper 2TM domain-containing protein [Gammaproteobacteria bacterium]
MIRNKTGVAVLVFSALVMSSPAVIAQSSCGNGYAGCYSPQGYNDGEPNGYRSSTPMILGAILGGALGNELGHKKRNKQIGAVAGAVLGASIARDLTRRNQRNHFRPRQFADEGYAPSRNPRTATDGSFYARLHSPEGLILKPRRYDRR